LRVLVEEDFLGRGAVGGVIDEQRLELGGEVGKAARETVLGVSLQLAVGEVSKAIALGADQAVASAGKAWIEAEDDQPSFSITSSDTS
jgi:hypothetical protein